MEGGEGREGERERGRERGRVLDITILCLCCIYRRVELKEEREEQMIKRGREREVGR